MSKKTPASPNGQPYRAPIVARLVAQRGNVCWSRAEGVTLQWGFRENNDFNDLNDLKDLKDLNKKTKSKKQ